MRILLVLCFSPLLLLGQQGSITENFWSQKKARIGLSYSSDHSPNDPYTWQANNIVAVIQRDLVLELNIGLQPFKNINILRTQLLIGYNQTNFDKGFKDSWLLQNWNGNGFEETIGYNSWQLGLGMQVEPFAKKIISPYFSGHLLLAIPSHIHYELSQASGGLDFPGYREVNGGGRVSPGFKVDTGLRLLPFKHFCFTFGVYYIEQDVLVDWPTFSGRNHEKVLLALENTGVRMSLQYSW
ncbi:hypothetical protein [Lewinella cohaerens]|uniref:hypothetical protein n=1 Tax=Lewinella cohaerens TaxID=70995 RepID=UPI000376DAB5|nr:hypothetical protein [Lewinella cohaerens]